MKQTSLTIRIFYFPKEKSITVTELIEMQESLSDVFLKTIQIEDSYISIEEISFDISEDNILDVEMEISYEEAISDVEIMRKLFPSDFTLPELQNAYENILNKK